MRKVVAIDGPAGSGKGTVAKILAKNCNLVYIDTGAMYRAIAYATLNNNIALDEKGAERMQRLLDMLDELDDVAEVYHNWEE